MKIIGLTGGIGSGKSTVAKLFNELGVAVYIADDEAKKIMHKKEIKEKIILLLGEESFVENKLNKKYIADKVFQDRSLLEQLNEIVHPAVALHFSEWVQNQKGAYVIKEAAILFENGGYKQCDKTILVKATKRLRLKRVLKRDKSTVSEVEARMKNQWTDAKKEKLADFVIENNLGIHELKLQVQSIHQKLVQ
ncbi:MAG: dephospho-CoA kinase [Flavobacteriaceae bacterium]